MSFIFYAAILLVLLGVFFIYTSLEVRKVGRREDAVAEEKTGSSSFDDLPSPVDEPAAPAVTGVVSEPAPAASAPADAGIVTDTASSDFNIVLYVDEKGVALSDNSAGILEEGGAYDGFTRIGEGVGQIGADALSVRIGRKFFRYDYHRVREVRLRDGVSVVYLKGDTRGNIFIAENLLFPRMLDESFSRYSQKG